MSARQKIESINAKIKELEAKKAELQAAADAEVDTGSIAEGDEVTANYGRGDKARVVTGKVLGVTNNGKVDIVKALIGTGADSEIISLFKQQITGVAKVAPPAEPEVSYVNGEPVVGDNDLLVG